VSKPVKTGRRSSVAVPVVAANASARTPTAWLCAALLVATILAYLPALRAGFIWNDSDYVTAPHLRSLHGLWRIWFDIGSTEQYYPLLHGVFWVQHQLWGDAPLGYHLATLLLHVAAACLFALVLRRLAVPGAWLAAFVFALHPVCVESVAWVSEQKNTLSLVFYLLAALCYLRFDETRRPKDYALALGLFVCGLLSKTTTATLPPALLVVFWWRRGRLEWLRDVVPLLPWFALAAGMGLLSAWVERTYVGAAGAEFGLGFVERCLLAGRIIWFYLGKLFWPADLIFIYPRWSVDASVAWQWLFPVGVLALVAALWALRRRSRAPLAALLLFAGSLFPVLGFFNVYGFLFSFVADHWQYLPSLALIALATAWLARVLATRAAGVRWGVRLALVGTLGVLSWQQSRMYNDMETFYRTTIAQNPECWMAHNNLGGLLMERGANEEAAMHFERTLQIKPNAAKAHNNLGSIYVSLRRLPEALGHFETAVKQEPRSAKAHNNLAGTLRDLRRLDDALPHHAEAVRLDPEFADAHNSYGVTLRAAGRLSEALSQFQEAAALEPASAPAQLNLALTLSLLGRETESMQHYREARRLNPAIPELKP
jgi:tetratricopeptide (TPR) repeat protein